MQRERFRVRELFYFGFLRSSLLRHASLCLPFAVEPVSPPYSIDNNIFKFKIISRVFRGCFKNQHRHSQPCEESPLFTSHIFTVWAIHKLLLLTSLKRDSSDLRPQDDKKANLQKFLLHSQSLCKPIINSFILMFTNKSRMFLFCIVRDS